MPAARRRISAPSRSVEREDEDYEGDDQHSGNASKPYRGLSDELIFNIYNELFAARHGKITSKTPLPGLNDILVSKRIYAVARSAWLHSFRASSSARRVDRVVAGLLKDDTACSALRFFEIKVFANHENTAAAVLERLSNVRYLRLFFDKEQRRVGGDKFLFSRPLAEGLAQMPSLRRLDLLDPVRFETDFPVGALRLRHVKTAIENISPILSILLQQCAVQHLVMIVGRTSFLSIGDLPWASLQQLAIHFKENEDESAPADLLELLRAQLDKYSGPFPLQRVRLEALDEDADFAAIVDSTLSLFAPRGTTSFRFQTAGTAEFRLTGPVAGDVQQLEIVSSLPYCLNQRCTCASFASIIFPVFEGHENPDNLCVLQRNFAKLVKFLQHLPALQSLGLFGFSVGGVAQPLELEGLDEAQLVVEYPLLFALLTCLSRTSLRILAIRSGATFGAWHRWERPSNDEPFPFLPHKIIRR